jgi:RNA polymerase sigma factor (sigma-70 family)
MTAALQIEATSAPTGGYEDRALVEAAQAGGPARDQLVESCLPLVARVARNYRGAPSVQRAELMQDGVVGLLRALDHYDATLGTPFWGYASWWVRQAMQQLVCELSGPVVLSDRAVRQLARIRRAERGWYQEHGHAPTTGELSATTGLPATQIKLLLAAVSRARGLDDGSGPDGDGRASVGQGLTDPRSDFGFDSVVERLTADRLPDLLATLTPREAGILRSRFGLGGTPAQTLREVAATLDLSAERVRQIEQGALGKLRDLAGG